MVSNSASLTRRSVRRQTPGIGNADQGRQGCHYAFEGSLAKANPELVCHLFSLRCSAAGQSIGSGKVELSGFTDRDLAASAKGAVHFDWRRGIIEDDAGTTEVPKAMSRFDRWTADAAIANNAASISSSEIQQSSRKSAIDATVNFGDPAAIAFVEAKPVQSATR